MSYQTEAQKLNWILTKYYAYRNEMDRMKKDIENGDFILSYEETKIITILLFVIILLIMYLTLR